MEIECGIVNARAPHYTYRLDTFMLSDTRKFFFRKIKGHKSFLSERPYVCIYTSPLNFKEEKGGDHRRRLLSS